MTSWFSLVLLGLLLGSSSSQNPDLEDLVQRNSEFGSRLYRAVAARTDDNVLLPVFSVSTALVALLSGTEGPTQNRLQEGLRLGGLRDLPDLFQTLRSQVSPALQEGVALFAADGYRASPSYQNLVQSKLGGLVQNFASSFDAVDAIDRWSREQTGNRVQDLVEVLDQQTQMLVAVTAAMRAGFSPAFNSSSTLDERFYVDRYHVAAAPMMSQAGKFFLAYDRSAKAGVLRLAMAAGAAMLAVLPDEGVELSDVEEELSAQRIRTWIGKLRKTKLEVQIPRFLLERSYALRNVLQAMGVATEGAEVSEMGGAKLGEVYLKSVFSADESGDDVAAVGGAFPTPQPRLTFNRPFIVIVYHQATGSPLMIGRIVDPTKK